MRRLFYVSLLAALVAGVSAGSASADPTKFGRMFPSLPAFTGATSQEIAKLSQSMLDPGDDKLDGEAPSIITFGGQFLDHDITRDEQPTPRGPVDPTILQNFRTPALDLDQVYGNGPTASPQLYETDGAHLRVQNPNRNGVRDLPRNPNGAAIVGDDRDDENEIISQLHVAFLLAHNRLVDQGLTFDEARLELRRHWQRIVLDEYLPTVIGDRRVQEGIRDGYGLYAPGDPMPVEFSVGCFRFGHSEVRDSYDLSDVLPDPVKVFSLTGDDDLRGGRDVPADHVIDWGEFTDELRRADDANGTNRVRLIDTRISASLFALPIPGAEAEGSNVLAFRNMTRGIAYGLPSYESVARAAGVTPVGRRVFQTGTPLWYGMLRESGVGGGERLGKTCGRIVTDVFVGLLRADPTSVLNDPGFQLDPEIAGDDGRMTFSDLLVFAGVVDDTDE